MTNTIIKNAINKNDLQTAIKFANKLADVYVNFPAAQQFQVKALANGKSGFGAIEKLVGHNFISVEAAINLL